jgi:hypothetical protein
LEHLGVNEEEKELGEYKNGMIFWANLNHEYQAATAARGGNLNSVFHGTRTWNQAGVLAYMESHDEERLMFNALQNGASGVNNYNIRTLSTAIERMKQGAAFFFPIPGPKLIWQFGEVGYDISINQNGRVGRKPVRWEYFDDATRKSLYKTYQALINLRKMEAFRTLDVSQVSLALNNTTQKRMTIRHPSMNVHIIGNFSAFDIEEYELNAPTEGIWHDYFTGDTINVKALTEKFSMKAGEWHILTSVPLAKPESGLSPWKLQRYVKVPPLSAEDELFSNNIIVFPNPTNAQGIITLKAENPINESMLIKIFDVTGKEVQKRHTWKQLINKELTIDLHHLKTGVYLLEISDGKRKAVKRVLKE